MDYEITSDTHETIATLAGKFTFSHNQAFRKLLNEIVEANKPKVIIDVKSLEYIDSAALGMLLLLRETIQENEKTLELRYPRGQVAQLFEISKFDSLFTLVK